MMASHPYRGLGQDAFWKTAATPLSLDADPGFWASKFSLSKETIFANYGSCFAQHIGSALDRAGICRPVYEDAPEWTSKELRSLYSYGIYPARTGNIYTPTLFRQWLDFAINPKGIPDVYWENNGRIWDPIRPTIEPRGFKTRDEMIASREFALRCFKKSIEKSDVVIFTLGMTERWVDRDLSIEYPLCPGTAAGEFSHERYFFSNLSVAEVTESLNGAFQAIQRINGSAKMMLTISPVPLIATASGLHVMRATMRSKSILHAAACEFSDSKLEIDYFPSFEAVFSPFNLEDPFENDKRTVKSAYVNRIMEVFIRGLGYRSLHDAEGPNFNLNTDDNGSNDLKCDEVLLEAFRKGEE